MNHVNISEPLFQFYSTLTGLVCLWPVWKSFYLQPAQLWRSSCSGFCHSLLLPHVRLSLILRACQDADPRIDAAMSSQGWKPQQRINTSTRPGGDLCGILTLVQPVGGHGMDITKLVLGWNTPRNSFLGQRAKEHHSSGFGNRACDIWV